MKNLLSGKNLENYKIDLKDYHYKLKKKGEK